MTPSRRFLLLAVAAAVASLVVAAAPGAAAKRRSQPTAGAAIVGGQPADMAADYPFDVAIYYRGLFNCGGVVIAPTKVLTAGHCAAGLRVSKLQVVANRPRLADKSVGERIAVASKSVHPLFIETGRHDLAVLTLATPTTAPAATLATVEEDAAATALGSPLRIAGWGAKTPFRIGLPGFLKETTQRVVRSRRCKREYGELYTHETDICAIGKLAPRWSRRLGIKIFMGVCAGDSGSPLIADTPGGPRVVGVASLAGILCGPRYAPGAYARTAPDLSFIAGA